MLQTEYIRNLNCNYERLLLEEKPEENRYQYCILTRGGIRGVLPCSLRYINGLSYLYYDISSRQNISQLYSARHITREWVKDFLWSVKQLRQELERFLLDGCNILWYPEQVFQDLENHVFSFLYIPYYEGESSFGKLLEFFVERIDYNDEILVDCIYYMYEQWERNGEVYLQAQIYEDAKRLENATCSEKRERAEKKVQEGRKAQEGSSGLISGQNSVTEESGRETEKESGKEDLREWNYREQIKTDERKGLFGIFENRRRKGKTLQEEHSQDLELERGAFGYAVAEETVYEEEEIGRTMYMEEIPKETTRIRRLYSPEGELVASVDKPVLSIGKKKGEVDVVLEDASVSRMHARIVREKEEYYLEDLNATNGTFKNGLRMQPYEKRRLEAGDEIKCGRIVLIFR